ncbi:permease prefix domain 1-containing protein [Tsukamurella sp. 1534]|uniref:permease prefix domain 1-containing protein n=1 Tax=Tsukamurella sp. 1534 TaxID=1151061 RepID=UPI001ED9B1C5|nr:permease prefix domain 1-containing protein [Tsukamurella sp. 1534]
MRADEVDELESHLRESMQDLEERGLDADESFLVAVKRMGSTDAIAHEFAREHSDRLWKQLVLGGPVEEAGRRHELAVVLALGVAAALSTVASVHLLGDAAPRFLGFAVAPFLAGYFAWKRELSRRTVAALAGVFAVLAAVLALYPFRAGGDTEILTAMAVPAVLWCGVAVAYTGGEWRSAPRRMDFVRFTGEFVIYFVLIALGGGAVTGLAVGALSAVGIDAEVAVGEWIVPACAAGAVLVAAWLVEAKQEVIENIAPVLTRIFTPVTLLMLVVVLGAFASRPGLVGADRDLLVLMTVVLVLVVGLLLYAVSARDPRRRPDVFDRLQVALVVAAVVVDAVVLVAMVTRIAEFGTSPNKVAVLGLNLLLVVVLVRSAWLGLGFCRGTRRFGDVEEWQTASLPAFAAWAAVVALAFPPLFGFI